MLKKSIKNGLYKTLDVRSKEDSKVPFTEPANILKEKIKKKLTMSSNKISSYAHHQAAKLKTEAPVWHLSTFSSPEQLSKIKERKEQIEHDAMLRKELAKFRAEVEGKFRASATNHDYVFPRNLDPNTQDELNFVKDFPTDCIFLHNTYVIFYS